GRPDHPLAPLSGFFGTAGHVRLVAGGADFQAGGLPGLTHDQADVGRSGVEPGGGWYSDAGGQLRRYSRRTIGRARLQMAGLLSCFAVVWWVAGGGNCGPGAGSSGIDLYGVGFGSV